MNETRYAILIGNNKYSGTSLEPLSYAVKDAEDFSAMLAEHCRFLPENIYCVTDSATSVKDQIDKAFDKIKLNFRNKEDLLLFYFSGHGKYDVAEAQSKIIFEDGEELNIKEILSLYFDSPSPKNSYLLIDACQSGAQIHSKGTTTEKQIRVLNQNAYGMNIMFATENKRFAYETDKHKNSYFTYYFINAVKSEKLYDDDGLLTMQAIDNHIKKHVSKESNYVQIPVSELHGTGYKPFAYLKSKMKSESKKDEVKKTVSSPSTTDEPKSPSSLDLTFEESLSRESRLLVQQKISKTIIEAFDSMEEKLAGRDFSIADNFEGLPGTSLIYKGIINKANQADAEGMDEMFEIKQREKNPYNFNLSIGSIVNQFLQEQQPELTYHIYSNTEFFFSRNVYVKGSSLYEIRGGLVVIVYQTKFGFAIGTIRFYYDWTGLQDDKMITTGAIIKPYTVTNYPEDKVTGFIQNTITGFPDELQKWTEKRSKEISDYRSKADKN